MEQIKLSKTGANNWTAKWNGHTYYIRKGFRGMYETTSPNGKSLIGSTQADLKKRIAHTNPTPEAVKAEERVRAKANGITNWDEFKAFREHIKNNEPALLKSIRDDIVKRVQNRLEAEDEEQQHKQRFIDERNTLPSHITSIVVELSEDGEWETAHRRFEVFDISGNNYMVKHTEDFTKADYDALLAKCGFASHRQAEVDCGPHGLSMQTYREFKAELEGKVGYINPNGSNSDGNPFRTTPRTKKRVDIEGHLTDAQINNKINEVKEEIAKNIRDYYSTAANLKLRLDSADNK